MEDLEQKIEDLLSVITNVSDTIDVKEQSCMDLARTICSSESQEAFIRILSHKYSIASLFSPSKEHSKLMLTRLLMSLTNLCTGSTLGADFMLLNLESDNLQILESAFSDNVFKIRSKRVILHFLVNLLSASDPSKLTQFKASSNTKITDIQRLLDIGFAQFFDDEIDEIMKDISTEDSDRTRLDEWVYLFVLKSFEKLGLECVEAYILGANFDRSGNTRLSTHAVRFYEFVFGLLQKTVEQKVHYSIIREYDATLLETDEYCRSQMNPDKAGLQLSVADLDYLSISFISLYETITQTESEERTNNLMEHMHWYIKLLIPVTFLGGYNKEVQLRLFPIFLGKLSQYLQHLQKKVYPIMKGLEKRAIFETNTDILRLAGNLIHTFSDAQNFLLDNGYVMSYMNYACDDMNNPLAREATIIFIRYITDTNQRARDVLSALKVDGIDPESIRDLPDYSFM